MNLSPVFRQRFFNANGVPLSGGQLFSYAAGTTTPQGTYSDSTGTTNANPVVLDSSGYADVWLDPTLAYKLKLEDASNNVLWTVDNITFATGINTWNANTVYQQGNIVLDSSGQGILYVSLINTNQNNALTSVSSWRSLDGNIRTVSTNTTLTITDNEVRSNSTSGSLTHTLPACSATPVGKKITVKDVGTGGNNTSIKGAGTDSIDGVVTYGTALPKNGFITVENTGSTWDVIAISTFVAPTVQKFTSSTGTYTTPTSPAPRYIRVRMVGGGGGGGGSGVNTDTGTAGGTGGNTTFGTSLLVANGGVGSPATNNGVRGGAGGTASLGSGPIGLAIGGSCGGAGGGNASLSPSAAGGGNGGVSPFGGAGGGGYGTSTQAYLGIAAQANSGSGGGGGSAPYNTSGAVPGAGGGSGGFVDAIIASPSATYAYAVGAAGAGGTAVSLGVAGGAGGSGLIIVEEFYQ